MGHTPLEDATRIDQALMGHGQMHQQHSLISSFRSFWTKAGKLLRTVVRDHYNVEFGIEYIFFRGKIYFYFFLWQILVDSPECCKCGKCSRGVSWSNTAASATCSIEYACCARLERMIYWKSLYLYLSPLCELSGPRNLNQILFNMRTKRQKRSWCSQQIWFVPIALVVIEFDTLKVCFSLSRCTLIYIMLLWYLCRISVIKFGALSIGNAVG